MTTGNMLASALKYAAKGWYVLPCRPSGKEPLIPHGVLGATADEDTIRRWWEAWPTANVAIATGARSGIVALDVDPRHGGDESLAAITQRYGPLPATLTVLTGGGGRHFYFTHPGGNVKNASGLGGWPGIDLRADGGYVLAPPSIHPSGQAYRWKM